MKAKISLFIGLVLLLGFGSACASPLRQATGKETLHSLQTTGIGFTVATVPSETAPPTTITANSRPTAIVTLSTAEQAVQILQGMSLRAKIGQIFLIRPESLLEGLNAEAVHDSNRNGVTVFDLSLGEKLRLYPPGGIVLFGKNIQSPEQVRALNSAFQRASSIPLLIGVDEEGGTVARIANTPGFPVSQYPPMMQIGLSGDAEQAGAVGRAIGAYLKEYGFNLNFAPVADVHSNPANTVIGMRAFSSDPSVVSTMVAAEIQGLHEQGIMQAIKHFPGHGDTSEDSHKGMVFSSKNWTDLQALELIPFVTNLKATDMVMVAHISLPQITGNDLPASLSQEMIERKLRGELGYTGLVITDSLAMGAIANEYSAAETAVLALQAGVDVLLIPSDYVAAFEGVELALVNGRITEARLNEAVLRILQLKLKYGLIPH